MIHCKRPALALVLSLHSRYYPVVNNCPSASVQSAFTRAVLCLQQQQRCPPFLSIHTRTGTERIVSSASRVMSSKSSRSSKETRASSKDDVQKHADSITNALQSIGQSSKKAWWERYLKGEIEFYGVPMADIRSTVKFWVDENDLKKDEKTFKNPFPLLRETAFSLLRQPIAEQKLAAILIFQNHVDIVTTNDLRVLEDLFRAGFIYDWNTTDWLCVRVLGPAVQQENGVAIINVLKEWVRNPENVLWQKRAALVAFVDNTAGHADSVIEISSTLVTDGRRFAQTAIGWVMRNLSATHPTRVVSFGNDNKQAMSSEAINMSCAKLSDQHRRQVGLTTGKKRKRR